MCSTFPLIPPASLPSAQGTGGQSAANATTLLKPCDVSAAAQTANTLPPPPPPEAKCSESKPLPEGGCQNPGTLCTAGRFTPGCLQGQNRELCCQPRSAGYCLWICLLQEGGWGKISSIAHLESRCSYPHQTFLLLRIQLSRTASDSGRSIKFPSENRSEKFCFFHCKATPGAARLQKGTRPLHFVNRSSKIPKNVNICEMPSSFQYN